MKYIKEYLKDVIKVKPLGELTTKDDELNGISGEMVYIDGKCSDIFITHIDYVDWFEKQSNKSINIDIESMVSSYKQRLKSQAGIMENNPFVNMCLTAFRRGIENTLEELNLKKLEKQSEQETLCDKCRKEHPSHSCQDITELGRCSVEHEQETDNSYCQENCKGFQETGRCFCDGECKAKKEYIKQNLQKNNFPQIEQKPAWSKEDDYNVQCLIAKVTYDIQKGNVGRNYKLIDWLKSLKKRMNNV